MADKQKYSTVSVRLTEAEKKELEQFCEENDLSMSQVIRRAVKEYIKN
jgi:predicted transcriptional regulator